MNSNDSGLVKIRKRAKVRNCRKAFLYKRNNPTGDRYYVQTKMDQPTIFHHQLFSQIEIDGIDQEDRRFSILIGRDHKSYHRILKSKKPVNIWIKGMFSEGYVDPGKFHNLNGKATFFFDDKPVCPKTIRRKTQ